MSFFLSPLPSLLNLMIGSCLTVHLLFVTLLDQLNQLLLSQCQSVTFHLSNNVKLAKTRRSTLDWDRDGPARWIRSWLGHSFWRLAHLWSRWIESSIKLAFRLFFAPVRLYLSVQWKLFQRVQRWSSGERVQERAEEQRPAQRRDSIPCDRVEDLQSIATNSRSSSNRETEMQLLKLLERMDLVLQWAANYSKSVDRLRDHLQQRLEVEIGYAEQLTHLCQKWRSQMANLGMNLDVPLQSLFECVVQAHMQQSNTIFGHCERLLTDDFKRPLKAQAQQFNFHLNRLRNRWTLAAHDLQQKMAVLRSDQRDYGRKASMVAIFSSGNHASGAGLGRSGRFTHHLSMLEERREEEEEDEEMNLVKKEVDINRNKVLPSPETKKKKRNQHPYSNKSNGSLNGKVPKSILTPTSSTSSASTAPSPLSVSFSDSTLQASDQPEGRLATSRRKMVVAEFAYRDSLVDFNQALKQLHLLHVQVVREIHQRLLDCEKNVRVHVCGYMRYLCPKFEPIVCQSACEQHLKTLLAELPVEPLVELKFVAHDHRLIDWKSIETN